MTGSYLCTAHLSHYNTPYLITFVHLTVAVSEINIVYRGHECVILHLTVPRTPVSILYLMNLARVSAEAHILSRFKILISNADPPWLSTTFEINWCNGREQRDSVQNSIQHKIKNRQIFSCVAHFLRAYCHSFVIQIRIVLKFILPSKVVHQSELCGYQCPFHEIQMVLLFLLPNLFQSLGELSC